MASEKKNDSNFVRGRFSKDISALTAKFTSSLDVDKNLAVYDILGSIAHVRELKDAGLISEKEKKELEGNLQKIKKEIETGVFKFEEKYEDIHINIEKRLIELLPSSGPKLHTGRSRNDQVSVDFRLYVKGEIKKISALVLDLVSTLSSLGEDNINTFMPGYTHLQHAQPVSLAHYFLAYCEMFKRDFKRLHGAYDEADVLTLGSGALAGVDFKIDRGREAKTLGFKHVSENSIDSVSDRDFAIQFQFSLSMIMLHLSRFCEELIMWNTKEFSFVELSDEFTTGSSIMPQKKNPDALELIRGRSGGVMSGMVSLLIMMKSLPLAYNRDMQEDKKPVIESSVTVADSLKIFREIIIGAKFNYKNMASGLKDDFIYATDISSYLVNRGVPFRRSHEIVGKLVNYASRNNKGLSRIPLSEYKKLAPEFEPDLFEIFNPRTSVDSKKTYGSTATARIKSAIRKNEKEIKEYRKTLKGF